MDAGEKGICKHVNILLIRNKNIKVIRVYIPPDTLVRVIYTRVRTRERMFQEGEMRESELEKRFREMVREAGGKAYKFISPGNDGVPDRLVVLPGGRVGFIELKQKGKRPRKLQQHRMAELESMGCFTAVVDDLETAGNAIAVIGMQAPQSGKVDSLFLEMINARPYRKIRGDGK